MDCPEAVSRVDSLGLSKWWRFIKGDDLEVEWNDSIDHYRRKAEYGGLAEVHETSLDAIS